MYPGVIWAGAVTPGPNGCSLQKYGGGKVSYNNVGYVSYQGIIYKNIVTSMVFTTGVLQITYILTCQVLQTLERGCKKESSVWALFIE